MSVRGAPIGDSSLNMVRDYAVKYATYLCSHQVGAIRRVNILGSHIRVKVTLMSNPTVEFPTDPNVWLSIRQLDDKLQTRVYDFLAWNKGDAALVTETPYDAEATAQ